MQEAQKTWIRPLGQEDPLEEEVANSMENSMDRGAWRATVHGAAKSQAGLSDRARAHTLTHVYTYS